MCVCVCLGLLVCLFAPVCLSITPSVRPTVTICCVCCAGKAQHQWQQATAPVSKPLPAVTRPPEQVTMPLMQLSVVQSWGRLGASSGGLGAVWGVYTAPNCSPTWSPRRLHHDATVRGAVLGRPWGRLGAVLGRSRGVSGRPAAGKIRIESNP